MDQLFSRKTVQSSNHARYVGRHEVFSGWTPMLFDSYLSNFVEKLSRKRLPVPIPLSRILLPISLTPPSTSR